MILDKIISPPQCLKCGVTWGEEKTKQKAKYVPAFFRSALQRTTNPKRFFEIGNVDDSKDHTLTFFFASLLHLFQFEVWAYPGFRSRLLKLRRGDLVDHPLLAIIECDGNLPLLLGPRTVPTLLEWIIMTLYRDESFW